MGIKNLKGIHTKVKTLYNILKGWFDVYGASSLHDLNYAIELVKCHIYTAFKVAPSEEQDDEPY